MLKIINKPEYKNRDFLTKITREEAGPEPKKVLTREQYELAFHCWSRLTPLARKDFDKLFEEIMGVSFIEYSKAHPL